MYNSFHLKLGRESLSCQHHNKDDPTVHVTMFALRPVVLLMIEATFQDYAWGSQSTRWAGHRGESRTS